MTIINDLDGCRVLDVVETRTTTATMKLLTGLAVKQRKKVLSVSFDMWKPFAHAVRKKGFLNLMCSGQFRNNLKDLAVTGSVFMCFFYQHNDFILMQVHTTSAEEMMGWVLP